MGLWFSFREMRISPCIGPTVAESLRAVLVELYGSPILSRMTSICSSPTSSRIAASTLAKYLLGLLDPCCGRSTYVKPHLSRVYLRKEVHTEQRKQQQRCDQEHAEHDRRPTVDRLSSQNVAVDLAELFKTTFEISMVRGQRDFFAVCSPGQGRTCRAPERPGGRGATA